MTSREEMVERAVRVSRYCWPMSLREISDSRPLPNWIVHFIRHGRTEFSCIAKERGE